MKDYEQSPEIPSSSDTANPLDSSIPDATNRLSGTSGTTTPDLPTVRDKPKKYNDNEWKLIVALMAQSDSATIQKIDGLLPRNSISPEKRAIFDAIIATRAELASPVINPIAQTSSSNSEAQAFAQSRLVLSHYFDHAIRNAFKRTKSGLPPMTALYQGAIKTISDPDLLGTLNDVSGESWKKLIEEINTSSAAAAVDNLKDVLKQIVFAGTDSEQIKIYLRDLVGARIDLSEKFELLESTAKIAAAPSRKGANKPSGEQGPKVRVRSIHQNSPINDVARLQRKIVRFTQSTTLKDRVRFLKSIRAATIRLEADLSWLAKEAEPQKIRLVKRIVVPFDDADSPLRPRQDNDPADTARAGLILANPSKTINTDRLTIVSLAAALGCDFQQYANCAEFTSSLTKHDDPMLVAFVSETDVMWGVLLQQKRDIKLYAVSAQQPGKLVLTAQKFNGGPFYALPLKAGRNAPKRVGEMSPEKLIEMFPHASYIDRHARRNHNFIEQAPLARNSTTPPVGPVSRAEAAKSDNFRITRSQLNGLRSAGRLYQDQSRPHIHLSNEFFALLAKHQENTANSTASQLTDALKLALTLCKLNPEQTWPETQTVDFKSVFAAWHRKGVRQYDSLHALLRSVRIGRTSSDITALLVMQDRGQYRQTFVLCKRGSKVYFIDPKTTNLEPTIIRHILDLEDRALPNKVLPVNSFLLRMDANPNWGALRSPEN